MHKVINIDNRQLVRGYGLSLESLHPHLLVAIHSDGGVTILAPGKKQNFELA